MRDLLNDFFHALDAAPVRTWSLIVTIYGDCVMPRGGELWLGTLTQILSAFDVESGSTRTAVSRLARDGFLERRRVGRTSHYRLSGSALALSQEAERVIYRARSPRAAAGWDLVIPAQLRPAVRRNLLQAGYGSLVPGLFARPRRSGPTPAVGEAIHLSATGDDAAVADMLYPMAEIAARYQTFGEATQSLLAAVGAPAPREALTLRVALVHGFRRIVLRDPHLCEAALPAHWPADAAYAAFAKAHRALSPAADAWLERHGRNADGPLPRPVDKHRFREPGRAAAAVNV